MWLHAILYFYVIKKERNYFRRVKYCNEHFHTLCSLHSLNFSRNARKCIDNSFVEFRTNSFILAALNAKRHRTKQEPNKRISETYSLVEIIGDATTGGPTRPAK